MGRHAFRPEQVRSTGRRRSEARTGGETRIQGREKTADGPGRVWWREKRCDEGAEDEGDTGAREPETACTSGRGMDEDSSRLTQSRREGFRSTSRKAERKTRRSIRDVGEGRDMSSGERERGDARAIGRAAVEGSES